MINKIDADKNKGQQITLLANAAIDNKASLSNSGTINGPTGVSNNIAANTLTAFPINLKVKNVRIVKKNLGP